MSILKRSFFHHKTIQKKRGEKHHFYEKRTSLI